MAEGDIAYWQIHLSGGGDGDARPLEGEKVLVTVIVCEKSGEVQIMLKDALNIRRALIQTGDVIGLGRTRIMTDYWYHLSFHNTGAGAHDLIVVGRKF